MTSSMRSPSFSVSISPLMWNSIGSEAMARSWSATVSSPSQLLAGRLGLLRELDVEHRRAGGLARQFAGRQRHHGRQHPRLHLGDAGRAGCRVRASRASIALASSGDSSDGSVVPSVNIIRSGSSGERGHHLGLVEHLRRLDDDGAGGVIGLLRRRRQRRDARVGHVHGAEQVGRRAARLLDLPQQALAVRRRGGFLLDPGEQRRILWRRARPACRCRCTTGISARALPRGKRQDQQERQQEQHVDAAISFSDSGSPRGRRWQWRASCIDLLSAKMRRNR